MVDKKETQRHNWEEIAADIDKECTCNNCDRKDVCEFAFDLYNYGGDCLWSK